MNIKIRPELHNAAVAGAIVVAVGSLALWAYLVHVGQPVPDDLRKTCLSAVTALVGLAVNPTNEKA